MIPKEQETGKIIERRQHQAMWQRLSRDKRRGMGLCVRCGKLPAVIGHRKCYKCAEIIRLYKARHRKELRRMGLCVKCGKKKPMQDILTCYDCTMKRRAREIDYYSRNVQKRRLSAQHYGRIYRPRDRLRAHARYLFGLDRCVFQQIRPQQKKVLAVIRLKRLLELGKIKQSEAKNLFAEIERDSEPAIKKIFSVRVYDNHVAESNHLNTINGG
jgi:hypothetical protein